MLKLVSDTSGKKNEYEKYGGKAGKKQQKKKKYGAGKEKGGFPKWILFLLVFLLLLGIGFYVVIVGFQVESVKVEGNVHYTQEEIIDMVMTNRLDQNSLYLSLKYKNKEIQNIPFIDTMNVKVLSPHEVQITVYEKALAGYVEYLGSYMYFDKDGTIVEVSDTKTQGIPQVTGIEFDHVILYEPLPVENQKVFQDILSITQLLTKYDIAAEKIYFNESFEMTLYFGNAKVRLGSGDNIEEKIMKLKTILPDIDKKSGVLHLENYQQGDENITFQLDKDSVSGN